MKPARVAVTDAATVKVAAQDEAIAPLSFAVLNRGPNSAWLGDEAVTHLTGYELTDGDSISIDFPTEQAETLWAICATGETATLQLLKTSGS